MQEKTDKMRRKPDRTFNQNADDTDFAPAPSSGISVISSKSDIEFYEDLISDPVLVLGMDITHLSRNGQFLICSSGVFFFSLLYGYLQELLSVQLCSRQLGLYLAMVQFIGYTFLAYILRSYVYQKQNHQEVQRNS